MKKVLIIIAGLFLNLCLSAHPWKPNHYVIIDTDGGVDDMKAISMMLASPDVRVMAIITSSGALNPENAYKKVKSLLNSFYHEGIPVGINRNKDFDSPEFPAAKNYMWGNETEVNAEIATDYIDVIKDIIRYDETRISFICLGGLNTVAGALKEIPVFRSRVKEIIWSSNGLRDTKGFNYNIDRKSSRMIMNQDLPVKTVGAGAENETEFYDPYLLEIMKETNTRYAKSILEFMESETASGHPFSKNINDELVPLYIHFPDLFTSDSTGNKSENFPENIQALKGGFIKILKGETVARNQVIKEFPEDPSFYFDDLNPFVTEIISKYGLDEWVSGVLANELHRHLGVFAIIGVKMGIRAREYFDTGVDEFRLTSFAGSEPPLSCMNDGLQVSTGATPGHGLLNVRDDTIKAPMAVFTYMNNRLRISLKPDLAQKISYELKDINFVYGLDSNIYWELVRKNSIRYWRDLDRHQIFDIEVIK
jgi:pyrimidine-specific ribonucleoside hydrolase